MNKRISDSDRLSWLIEHDFGHLINSGMTSCEDPQLSVRERIDKYMMGSVETDAQISVKDVDDTYNDEAVLERFFEWWGPHNDHNPHPDLSTDKVARTAYRAFVWGVLDGYTRHELSKAMHANKSESETYKPEHPPRSLRDGIARVINENSREGKSSTPDYVIADFLIRCLSAFEQGVEARDHHSR